MDIDTLKKILTERFRSSLFGYIAFSWVSYNWSNIAILFMSKYPVLSRIETIKKIPSPYINEIILPVITGVTLTILIPYIQFILNKTQSYLELKKKAKINDDSIYEIKNEIILSSLKAERDASYDLEKAKVNLKIAKIEEDLRKSELNIDSLNEEKSHIEEQIIQLKKETSSLDNKKSKLKNSIITALLLLNDINETSSMDDVNKWKKLLKDQFSSDEIKEALFMKKILNEETNLSIEEQYKLLDLIEENKKIQKIKTSNDKQ